MAKSAKHKIKYTIIFSIIIVFVLICIWYDFLAKPTYRKFITTNQPSTVRLLRNRDSISNHFEYDFTYRQGCHNCMKMQSTVAPLLQSAKRHNAKLLILNANHKPLKSYLDKTQQDDFPTVALRYHGYLIYQYSGMNKHIFKDIFHHVNPQTGRYFSHRIPQRATLINSFDGTKKHIPSYETYDDFK